MQDEDDDMHGASKDKGDGGPLYLPPLTNEQYAARSKKGAELPLVYNWLGQTNSDMSRRTLDAEDKRNKRAVTHTREDGVIPQGGSYHVIKHDIKSLYHYYEGSLLNGEVPFMDERADKTRCFFWTQDLDILVEKTGDYSAHEHPGMLPQLIATAYQQILRNVVFEGQNLGEETWLCYLFTAPLSDKEDQGVLCVNYGTRLVFPFLKATVPNMLLACRALIVNLEKRFPGRVVVGAGNTTWRIFNTWTELIAEKQIREACCRMIYSHMSVPCSCLKGCNHPKSESNTKRSCPCVAKCPHAKNHRGEGRIDAGCPYSLLTIIDPDGRQEIEENRNDVIKYQDKKNIAKLLWMVSLRRSAPFDSAPKPTITNDYEKERFKPSIAAPSEKGKFKAVSRARQLFILKVIADEFGDTDVDESSFKSIGDEISVNSRTRECLNLQGGNGSCSGSHKSQKQHYVITPWWVDRRCHCKHDTAVGRHWGPCKTFKQRYELSLYQQSVLFGSRKPLSRTKELSVLGELYEMKQTRKVIDADEYMIRENTINPYELPSRSEKRQKARQLATGEEPAPEESALDEDAARE